VGMVAALAIAVAAQTALGGWRGLVGGGDVCAGRI
jgi:hypothetical protein